MSNESASVLPQRRPQAAIRICAGQAKNRACAGWGCHFQRQRASVRRRAALAARLASVRHIRPGVLLLASFMHSVYPDPQDRQ